MQFIFEIFTPIEIENTTGRLTKLLLPATLASGTRQHASHTTISLVIFTFVDRLALSRSYSFFRAFSVEK